MKYIQFILLYAIVLMTSGCSSDTNTLLLTISSASYEASDVPVHVKIDRPAAFTNTPTEDITITLESGQGEYQNIPGQLVQNENGQEELWWILPETSDSQPLEWKATFYKKSGADVSVFSWQDDPGKHMDLLFGQKKVFRYEYELDSQLVKGKTLTAKNKVFFHIYDLSGEHLITNGYEDGVWPHHRGIMIGWRDVGFRDQELSFWGMEDLTTQKHVKFVKKTAGPVLATLEALIHWNDSTGTTVLEEHRLATVYHQHRPGIMLLDFSSNLKAINGPVTLDGNAEHAGVQYRAHNDVAAEAPGSEKPTYFFNKEGIDPTTDYNLPWVGMSYGLNNKTYSVVEMNDPDNPKPATWSAYRDYGRFGPYIKYDLEHNESFDVNYRFWISESAMPDRGKIAAKYKAYQHPPDIMVE